MNTFKVGDRVKCILEPVRFENRFKCTEEQGEIVYLGRNPETSFMYAGVSFDHEVSNGLEHAEGTVPLFSFEPFRARILPLYKLTRLIPSVSTEGPTPDASIAQDKYKSTERGPKLVPTTSQLSIVPQPQPGPSPSNKYLTKPPPAVPAIKFPVSHNPFLVTAKSVLVDNATVEPAGVEMPAYINAPPSMISFIYENPVNAKKRGIEYDKFSCNLDSMFFAMFGFSSIFDFPMIVMDSRVEGEDRVKDEVVAKARAVIANAIVNPLRSTSFCPWQAVTQFRNTFKPLRLRFIGTNNRELDLIMNRLFSLWNLESFIKYEEGPGEYLHKLDIGNGKGVIERHMHLQRLLELSMFRAKHRLSGAPFPAMIVEIPKHWNQVWRGVNGIVPSLVLDLNHFTLSGQRLCYHCGMTATTECRACFDYIFGTGMETMSYCPRCLESFHKILSEENLKLHECLDLTPCDDEPYNKYRMDLLAIICCKDNEYVSFVKTGPGDSAAWLFQNSNGGDAPHIEVLLEMSGIIKKLEKMKIREIPAFWPSIDHLIKRALTQSRICIYGPAGGTFEKVKEYY